MIVKLYARRSHVSKSHKIVIMATPTCSLLITLTAHNNSNLITHKDFKLRLDKWTYLRANKKKNISSSVHTVRLYLLKLVPYNTAHKDSAAW